MKTKVWTKEGRGGTNDRANVISDMTERGTIGERKEQKILKGGGGREDDVLRGVMGRYTGAA